jgi:hypothetical protein
MARSRSKCEPSHPRLGKRLTIEVAKQIRQAEGRLSLCVFVGLFR